MLTQDLNIDLVHISFCLKVDKPLQAIVGQYDDWYSLVSANSYSKDTFFEGDDCDADLFDLMFCIAEAKEASQTTHWAKLICVR